VVLPGRAASKGIKGRIFFSEEKKQKTFIPGARA
jgi:hypothetical protein